jgi:hypothetical protein
MTEPLAKRSWRDSSRATTLRLSTTGQLLGGVVRRVGQQQGVDDWADPRERR